MILTMSDRPSASDLLKSILAVQKQRWAKGEKVPAEEFQKQHPLLFANQDPLLDLIYNEVCLREQAGERPKLPEYQQRFPELSEALRVQFEVHQAIQEDADSTRSVIPGYELLKEIGQGGMGLVYRARDLKLDCMVAVKVIKPELAAQRDVRKRFLNEAQAASNLDHPNIVKVHEVGDCAAGPFLVMELVAGSSLDSLLRQGPLPIIAAVEIAISLAEAVHHAHQAGIIHRDLKPGNILISEFQGESKGATPKYIVKIADFGLAKLLGSRAGPGQSSTRQGTLLGTPAFMPPEQLGEKRQTPGPWNDVYALGGILFAMLTGRPPYDEGNFVATVLRVKAALAPPEIRPQRPEVSADLEEVCRKCLRKTPVERFSSAQALADELRRIAPKLSPTELVKDSTKAWLQSGVGGESLELCKPITIIGRGRDCDIRLTAPEISRRHCRIIHGPDRLYVEDMGSQHGIRINGELKPSGNLREGDQLQIGPVAFIVHIRAS
jgi:serine/threonine protein kinase